MWNQCGVFMTDCHSRAGAPLPSCYCWFIYTVTINCTSKMATASMMYPLVWSLSISILFFFFLKPEVTFFGQEGKATSFDAKKHPLQCQVETQSSTWVGVHGDKELLLKVWIVIRGDRLVFCVKTSASAAEEATAAESEHFSHMFQYTVYNLHAWNAPAALTLSFMWKHSQWDKYSLSGHLWPGWCNPSLITDWCRHRGASGWPIS